MTKVCRDVSHRKVPFDLPKLTLTKTEMLVDVARLDVLKVWRISPVEYIVNPPPINSETDNVTSSVSVTRIPNT